MQEDEYTTLKYFFRFRVPKDVNFSSVLKASPLIQYEISDYEENEHLVEILVILSKNTNYTCLSTIKELLNLGRESYDILMTIVSEYDTRILDIPPYIEELAKQLDASFVFSLEII